MEYEKYMEKARKELDSLELVELEMSLKALIDDTVASCQAKRKQYAEDKIRVTAVEAMNHILRKPIDRTHVSAQTVLDDIAAYIKLKVKE